MTMYRLEVKGILRPLRIDPENEKSHKLYSVDHLKEVIAQLHSN